MKFEIINDDLSGQTGYQIREHKSRNLVRKAGLYPYNRFYNEDLELLLTEKQQNDFYDKGKYIFDIPNYLMNAITDDTRYYRPQDLDKISKFKVFNNL